MSKGNTLWRTSQRILKTLREQVAPSQSQLPQPLVPSSSALTTIYSNTLVPKKSPECLVQFQLDGLWLKDISKTYYFKSLNLRTISHAHCGNLSGSAIRERWQFPVFEYKHADTFAHTKYMPLGTHSVKENILDPLKQSTGSVIN